MNVSQLKKILSITICAVFLMCIVCVVVFENIKNTNNRISALQENMAQQNTQGEYTISLKRMIQNAEANVDTINSLILGTNDDVHFIETLEKTGKQNGLSTSIDSLDVTNNDALTPAGMSSLDVKFETTGSWLGTYTFLNELETMPFVISVQSLSIRQVSDGTATHSGGAIWSGTFQISVLKKQ